MAASPPLSTKTQPVPHQQPARARIHRRWLFGSLLVGSLALLATQWGGLFRSPEVLSSLLILGLGLVLADNGRLRRQRAAYAYQAIHDPLTGLFNKGYYDLALAREADHSRRYGTPLTLILLDLDEFKRINDTYGHLAGDDVLRRVGQVCRATLRTSDIPCRCGGDEFAVILPYTALAAGQILATRLQQALTLTFPPAYRHQGLGVSLGVATTLTTCAPDQLHAHADQALYRAKHTGKHQIATGLPHVPAQATRPPNDTEPGLHYPSGTPAAWIQ